MHISTQIVPKNQIRKTIPSLHVYVSVSKVLIPSNCIHQKYYSIKTGCISYFLSSDIERSHDLWGPHAIGINS